MAPTSAAVLFDLDGVLVDSRVAITTCINHALREHELPARSQDELTRFIGPPLALAFAELAAHRPESTLVASCIRAYRTHYRDLSLTETTVVPDMPMVLSELRAQFRLGVASSKPLAFADPILRRLGLSDFFEVSVGPPLSALSHDKSVTIAEAMRRIGPVATIMVGDRDVDILGARECSIPAIAVSWGIGSLAELSAAGPAAIVHAPAELPEVIGDLFARNGAWLSGAT